MIVLEARNTHAVLPRAIRLLSQVGRKRESRAGNVFVMDTPVTTLYTQPTERVIFHPERDANPYFHFMEAMWMLAGRDDVEWISFFNSNLKQFSDDGEIFNGAYGYRWRSFNCFDQLEEIATNLRTSPNCRRQVLQMWNPVMDLMDQGKNSDVCCNLCVHFQVNHHGHLDMSVFCRSNDIIWGCYGSDSVTFSFLLEYMAARAGVPVGRYWQISDNWHGYEKALTPLVGRIREEVDNPYDELAPTPFVTDPDMIDTDLEVFVNEGTSGLYENTFFSTVAVPLLRSWTHFKNDRRPQKYSAARAALDECAAQDWAIACRQWIDRREAKWKNK